MRARIVPLEERHLSAMLGWLQDGELRDHIGTIYPIPMARHTEWYRSVIGDRSQVIYAIELDGGRHVGTIGLRGIDLIYRNAELWLYVGERDERGTGTARAAFDHVVDFGFSTLNLHRIFVHVFAFNARARKFFEKCGMKHEGTLREAVFKRGRYVDKHVLGLLAHEVRVDQTTSVD